jgi:hypothetical protein
MPPLPAAGVPAVSQRAVDAISGRKIGRAVASGVA